MIDRMLASGLAEGRISNMNYANRLFGLPLSIVLVSVVTVVYPIFSKLAAEKKQGEISRVLARAISTSLLAFFPIALICILFSHDMTQIAFQRGMFTPEDTAVAALILAIMVPRYLFLCFSDNMNRAFYAMSNTKTPRNIALAAIGLNIGLNLLLIRYMEVYGLILAGTLSALLSGLLSVWYYRRQYGAIGGRRLLLDMTQYGVAAACMLPVFWAFSFLWTPTVPFLPRSFFPQSWGITPLWPSAPPLARLVLPVIFCLGVYVLVLLLLRQREMLYAVKWVKEKVWKRKK